MTQRTYTPGPWYVEREVDTYSTDDRFNAYEIYGDTTHRLVARTQSPENAYFLASVPDLLQACEMCEAFYLEVRSTSHIPMTREMMDRYTTMSNNALVACVTAAKKARGELV